MDNLKDVLKQLEEKTTFKYIVDQNVRDGYRVEFDGVTYFDTINAALDFTKDIEGRVAILIKNGRYYEKLVITKPELTLVGESQDHTVLCYDDYHGKMGADGNKLGTFGSASVCIDETAEDFVCYNLTIANTFDVHQDLKDKQAVALRIVADRCIFYKVSLLGNQDTLYADKGRQLIYDSYIEGDVDFIFGGSQLVIDSCHIHSLMRTTHTPCGYVTAPRTNHDLENSYFAEFGYLISNCKLTSNIDLSRYTDEQLVYLGRPWRQHAHVAYINNEMGDHISSIGWTSMGGGGRTNYPEEATFREYGSFGPGAKTSATRQLMSSAEASKYTLVNVLQPTKVHPKEFNIELLVKKALIK